MKHLRRLLLVLAVVVLLTPLWLAYRQVRQDSLDRALIAAVRRSDAIEVSYLLAKGANPNAKDYGHKRLSYWQAVMQLVHVRHATNKGQTALAVAFDADEENPDIVKALMAHGGSGVPVATEEDRKVFAAFLDSEDFEKNKFCIVEQKTETHQDKVIEFNDNFKASQKNLNQRATQEACLPPLPTHKSVQFINETELSQASGNGLEYGIYRNDYKAFLYSFSLPGYSMDKSTACFYFGVFDRTHINTGIVFLVKEKEHWKVKTKDYYATYYDL